jgi:N-acetylmuramoyl-L-alanine amidase
MSKIQFYFLLIGFCLSLGTPVQAMPFKVVIDPGHGGHDEGTIFNDGELRVSEKFITLQIARQVAHHLQSKGVKVALTRYKDKEVSLPARTALANRLQADAFISIHMNSTESGAETGAEGIETYILNNATDSTSKRLARMENSVISTRSAESPQQMDVALILKDLRLDGNLRESKRLACSVQNSLTRATSQLSAAASRRNRGVKQALFHVLLGADMPSVLVEAGFLSSTRDRNAVLSIRGRAAMGKAIANAIIHFQQNKNSNRLATCKVR